MVRVGRTLLSDAFDVNFDFDLDREGHGFSRAAKHSVLKGRGFQPRRKAPQKWSPASAAEANRLRPKGDVIPNRAESPVRNLLFPVVILRKRSRAQSERLPTKGPMQPASSFTNTGW